MSFMDNILSGGGRSDAFNRQEGYCGILIAIIAADGHISKEEVIDFRSAIQKATILKGASADYISKMIDKCLRVLDTKGMDELIRLCAEGLTPDIYEGVFATACDMVFSDGSVDAKEIAVMDKIKAHLKINDQFARDCAEVFKAKSAI
jgi:uncharacterized tellurite resistance protein B-like protein